MGVKPPLTRRDLWSLDARTPPTDDALVHLASLLVQATPPACAQVRALLQRTRGAEVHETSCTGKLVVVLESSDDRGLAETTLQLQDIPGVINVSIVAHLIESERSLRAAHSDG